VCSVQSEATWAALQLKRCKDKDQKSIPELISTACGSLTHSVTQISKSVILN